MSLSDIEEEVEFCDHSDQVGAFCEAFQKFSTRAAVGEEFVFIATIEYSLPVGNEAIEDTINLWSSPIVLTEPWHQCFQERIEPAVLNMLKRFPNSDLLALSFRRCVKDRDPRKILGRCSAQFR